MTPTGLTAVHLNERNIELSLCQPTNVRIHEQDTPFWWNTEKNVEPWVRD